jgi:hypothetical protein
MSNYYTGKCFLGLSDNQNHSHMVEQEEYPLLRLVIKLLNHIFQVIYMLLGVVILLILNYVVYY